MKFIVFIIIYSPVYCLNGTNETDSRKRYGLGFYGECDDYTKVFRCMTKCKSLAYGVYRLDRKCKCLCLEVSTRPVLPYFKWRTTGTPRKLPTTRSPRLYDIVGTLSPFPFRTTLTVNSSSICPTLPAAPNGTDVTLPQITTESGINGTGISNQTEEADSKATSILPLGNGTDSVLNTTDSVFNQTDSPSNKGDATVNGTDGGADGTETEADVVTATEPASE